MTNLDEMTPEEREISIQWRRLWCRTDKWTKKTGPKGGPLPSRMVKRANGHLEAWIGPRQKAP